MFTSLNLAAIVIGVVLLISSDFIGCRAHKILLLPLYQKSHIASMISIADELDGRGHEAYVMQFDHFNIPMKSSRSESKIKQYTFELNKDFALDKSKGDMEKEMEKFVRLMLDLKGSFQDMISMANKYSVKTCSMILSNTDESFRKLKKERFDLAIIDGMAFTKCFYLIPHRLGIPWITYTDYPDQFAIRTPWLPSFIPHHFSAFTERMSFAERTKNALLTTYLYFNLPQLRVDDAILTEYRRYGAFDTLDDLVRRSELFLVTSDLVLEYAKPSMPNMIQVGGLTTKEPGNLPDDLRTFMDASEKGVVVVTFGTMLSTFPPHLSEKFISVFRQLDGYRVVWRMRNSENVTIPRNVMISNFLPQNDVLGHPKTKLFITHCGNNGQFEAIYNKVPMIGFPMLGDQKYNSIRMEYKDYGLAMNIFDFTADQLLSNVQKILTDPKYASRVSRASDIFKSATKTPSERAARWIEHVLTFGGSHLRSAGSDLPMYQYLLLDVLVTCVTAISVFAIVTYKIAYCLLKKCSLVGEHSKVTNQKKKKH